MMFKKTPKLEDIIRVPINSPEIKKRIVKTIKKNAH